MHTYVASGSIAHVFGIERVGFEARYYHRTFEDLVSAFRSSGFLLRTLDDVGPDSGDSGQRNVSVPSLMLLELLPWQPLPSSIDTQRHDSSPR